MGIPFLMNQSGCHNFFFILISIRFERDSEGPKKMQTNLWLSKTIGPKVPKSLPRWDMLAPWRVVDLEVLLVVQKAVTPSEV